MNRKDRWKPQGRITCLELACLWSLGLLLGIALVIVLISFWLSHK